MKSVFEANDLDQLSSHRKGFLNKVEYRSYVIQYLNKSLFISSPFGRLFSFQMAFQDKYVELKN